MLARGRSAGREAILLLSAKLGVLIDTIEPAGPFAIDPERRRLHVDVPARGLYTYDLDNLTLRSVIALPPPDDEAGELVFGLISVPPIVEPRSGQVLAFRDDDIHVLEPARARRLHRLRPYDDPSLGYIRGAILDPSRGWLYLQAFDSEIPAYLTSTRLMGYDLDRDRIFLEQGVMGRFWDLVAWDGHLWTLDGMHKKPGLDSRLWREGEPIEHIHAWDAAYTMRKWSGPRLAIDRDAGLRYLLLGDRAFAFDLEDDSQRFAGELPVDPSFDLSLPVLDGRRLSVHDGQLVARPARDVLPPAPSPAQDAQPHDWGWVFGRLFPIDEQRVFALSDFPASYRPIDLLLTEDMGRSWKQASTGIPRSDQISDLAISPDFARDRTLLASSRGSGIYRSTDGGRVWRPAAYGPDSRWIEALHLSPGFGTDGLAFADGVSTPFYDPDQESGWGVPAHTAWRSEDGGSSWQGMGRLTALALSPDFETDRRMWAFRIYTGNLLQSDDAGRSWQAVGHLPLGQHEDQWMGAALRTIRTPSARSPVLLAFVAGGLGTVNQGAPYSGGGLYRSQDLGRSWAQVQHNAGDSYPRFKALLGPFGENGADLLLHLDHFPDESLYRSQDFGASWTFFGHTSSGSAPALLPTGDLVLADRSGRLRVHVAEEWPSTLEEVLRRKERFLPFVAP